MLGRGTSLMLVLALVAGAALVAAELPRCADAAVRLRSVGRFEQPVYVTAPRGDPRLFVVERTGRVLIVRGGRKLPRPFLDIRRSVQFFDRHNVERDQGGLLSLAFPPDFRRSGRFYVFYTRQDRRLHIDEFERSPRNPNRASARSRRTVLSVPRQSRNDLGGQLQFGPDGLLYAGFGYGRDPASSASLSTLTGKIVRIDPRPLPGARYGIPSDNPFLARPGARAEIYAYGLRNPWRFSFDRRTDSLAIGDPGEARVEEIDFMPRGAAAGANFGWPVFEGHRRVTSGPSEREISPVLTVRHPRRGCRAIIGGYVVRDRAFGRRRGRYLYGDLCTGRLRSALLRRPRAVSRRSERAKVPFLVSFGEDARGGLYAISLAGRVYRILPA
jgi:glucose/arabinose dehydrogenase